MPKKRDARKAGLMRDVIIVGAGAAGIAAARKLKQAGFSPLVLEARPRLGGRAVTQDFAGTPIDLGAHWLHAARQNPLVALARGLGLEVSRAVYRFRALKDGTKLGLIASYGLDHAWERAEERIFAAAELAARRGQDMSLAEAVGNAGPWTRAALFMHGAYDCGAEPETISTLDFATVEDDRDMLVSGGLGALIARLGEGLEVTTGVDLRRIEPGKGHAILTGADGHVWQARAVILTVPLMVLAGGHVTLPPEADSLREASSRFHAAAYEHAILQAADASWSNRHDEIVLSMAGSEHATLFAHMEGSDLHYLDLVAAEGRAFARMDDAGRLEAVRATLARHFGEAASRATRILAVTQWAQDPFARGAWALARIGHSGARAALRQPMGRLFYAGEASSATQWGTVGGAWMEGERAAAQVMGNLSATEAI